jgi:hypothetical protein
MTAALGRWLAVSAGWFADPTDEVTLGVLALAALLGWFGVAGRPIVTVASILAMAYSFTSMAASRPHRCAAAWYALHRQILNDPSCGWSLVLPRLQMEACQRGRWSCRTGLTLRFRL